MNHPDSIGLCQCVHQISPAVKKVSSERIVDSGDRIPQISGENSDREQGGQQTQERREILRSEERRLMDQ